MKIAFVIVTISLMTTNAAYAFDCRGARATRAEYLREKEAIQKRLKDLEKRKKEAQADHSRVDGELARDLDMLARDIATKDEEVTASIIKRQLLGQEHKKISDELKAGLYCSKCNRSKTEIETEERVSFVQHLQDVKGRSKPASAAMLRKAYEDYKRKWKKSFDYTTKLENELEELETRKEPMQRAAEQKKRDLLAMQRFLEDEIKSQVYNGNPMMSKLRSLESEMKRNGCEP